MLLDMAYCIRYNYHTVCLDFFKITGRTCGKICIHYIKGTLKKRLVKDLSNDAYAIFFVCVCFFFIFFKKHMLWVLI